MLKYLFSKGVLGLVLGVVLCAVPIAIAKAGESYKSLGEVVVIGDSLAQGLHSGIYRLMAKQSLKHKLSKRTKISSGLVRKDKFNWPKAIKRIVAKRKFQSAIVTFGTNDLTSFRPRGGAIHFDNPKWDGLYARAVSEVIKTLRSKGIMVYWAGLPITRKNRYQKDYARLNRIFSKAAPAAGAIYIDTWSKFAVKGAYSAKGKDLNGKTATLRHRDGVHFTQKGYLVYADLVLRSALQATKRDETVAQASKVTGGS